ncbi:MAG: ErfK/YbiS/YcfS/YnhG family protein [Thermoleophilia bacterium]|nr:ErfK/YbiS/YcfS/YnhG family protein [Thermoleophilia bacterium]
MNARRAIAFSLVVVAMVFGATATARAGEVTYTPMTDGSTYAHWAHPEARGLVFRYPSASAAVVTRLHLDTESGNPEVYPVLQRHVDADGARWLQVAIAMRPNGQRGWVREHSMGPIYRVTTRLVVNRARLRATLVERGRVVWMSRVGVGAPATPTPPGATWVRERLVVADASGPYGPRAIGTAAYSRLTDWPGGGVVGLHGTDRPDLIPGRPSHGCIRIPNAAILKLYPRLPIGTPIEIV